jgi:hypothetical protein
MPILKTTGNNPDEELAFELAYQATLTIEQRFNMMVTRSAEISETMEKYGHKKSFEIIKRT